MKNIKKMLKHLICILILGSVSLTTTVVSMCTEDILMKILYICMAIFFALWAYSTYESYFDSRDQYLLSNRDKAAISIAAVIIWSCVLVHSFGMYFNATDLISQLYYGSLLIFSTVYTFGDFCNAIHFINKFRNEVLMLENGDEN